MADEPTEAGTPPTKEYLLPDTVRDALGLTGDASVADALGALNSRAKIGILTYTGTEVYGSSNPNTLTFDFAPKLLMVMRNDLSYLCTTYNDSRGGFIATKNTVQAAVAVGGYTAYCNLTWSNGGKTVSWYVTGKIAWAPTQLNESGVAYTAIALG